MVMPKGQQQKAVKMRYSMLMLSLLSRILFEGPGGRFLRRRLVKRRGNEFESAGNVCFGVIIVSRKRKAREQKKGVRRPALKVTSRERQVIADPYHQRHQHSYNRHPHRLQPAAFISRHFPRQQSHEEARRQSHRPLADQERRADTLQLLIQETEEWIVDGLIAVWGFWIEWEDKRKRVWRMKERRKANLHQCMVLSKERQWGWGGRR
jgi:hypothetical protein